MPVTRTKLFMSNRSQAVRLPKAVAFPDHVKEVEIMPDGRGVRIVPAGSSWDDFFAMLPASDMVEPEDFVPEDPEPRR